jgi:uncharacterized membrane protein
MEDNLLAMRKKIAEERLARSKEKRAQGARATGSLLGALLGGLAGTFVSPGVGTAKGAVIGGKLGQTAGGAIAGDASGDEFLKLLPSLLAATSQDQTSEVPTPEVK